MDELEIAIGTLEIREGELLSEICKPTDYGKCPSVKTLLGLDAPLAELGRVVYAINVLRDLKDAIESDF